MKAYSLDLRQKIVDAYDRKQGAQGQVAQTFGIGLGFVEKLLRQRRRTGDLAPRTSKGANPPARPSGAAVVTGAGGGSTGSPLQEPLY